MKVFIASDHGGFDLKGKLFTILQSNYDIQDLGPSELDMSDDYPKFAIRLSKEIQKNEDSKGILICRSGIGVCVTANRFSGVHAAVCRDIQTTKLAREHNNINVLCLDGDLPENEAIEIVKTFLETRFSDEPRHTRRLKMIDDVDSGHIELENLVTGIPMQDLPLT